MASDPSPDENRTVPLEFAAKATDHCTVLSCESSITRNMLEPDNVPIVVPMDVVSVALRAVDDDISRATEPLLFKATLLTCAAVCGTTRFTSN
jgi:hypothetical protein